MQVIYVMIIKIVAKQIAKGHISLTFQTPRIQRIMMIAIMKRIKIAREIADQYQNFRVILNFI